MQRQFTSGSRQAPDPYDQFLEEHQFYRKHTARDASCLFRVISEQMYDTQLHHLAIREKCVAYMRKHRKYFENQVDKDFDDYLFDMSKPKTYGTLLELRAASYMFERNVLLFQPYNLGNYFDEYRSNFVKLFRVFHTPERHFDSVFTTDYIQEAAICQSICYEILYKDVFQLPDVSFAVEQMLHGPTFENMEYRTEMNEDGYSTRLVLSDGRAFEMDLPHNTNCILENYKLCHFHYNNFPRYSDDLQRELKTSNSEDCDKNALIIQRTTESFLPNKYVSCVRQLLHEGITPFPYKVAKALDPNMYRNIEFDSWNEMRKEMKLQNWYNGDANFKLIRYSTRRIRKIFQVGAKCHVKLRKSEPDLYTCHIQEIAVDKRQCIVFVEQLGEKRLVPYENLTPLPPDQFKPWTVPYHLQRHMQKYSSVRFTRQYNYRFKFDTTTEHHIHGLGCESAVDNDSGSNNYIDDGCSKKLTYQRHNQRCTSASYFKLKQYTHLEDFRAHVEYCTMPLTVAHSDRDVEILKADGNQSVAPDSSENSRSPSRSSTLTKIHCNNIDVIRSKTPINNVEQQLESTPAFSVPNIDSCDVDHYNPNAAFYVPELHGFYHMYPYSSTADVPDDCYGYNGFENVLPPGAAFMPSVNNINGFCYLYNNTLTQQPGYINSSNQYILPPQPQQPLSIGQSSSMFASTNTSNHFPSATCSTQCNQNTLLTSSAHSSVSNISTLLPHKNEINTTTKIALSGRINYDAKKSYKINGIDLPSDVATLRFFYNMGLDHYQKQKSNETQGISAETNNEVETCSSDAQNVQFDENSNQISCPKLDVNNKNVTAAKSDISHSNDTNPTSNQITKHNSTNVKSNNQRRYSSRYFNGKDRQMPQRNNNSNKNSNNSAQQQQQQSNQNNHRTLNNYNNNNTKYSNNNSYGSVRNAQQQNIQQYLQPVQHTSSPQALLKSSGGEALPTHISYNVCEDTRSNSTEPRNCTTPTTTNNSNITVAYSKNADQMNEGISAGVATNRQLTVPMHTNRTGVYIPIPPAPYGIYAAHPTAPVPHQPPGIRIHPNYMTAGPPSQIITHCGIPPLHQSNINSGAMPDVMDNVCNSEIPTNNNGTLLSMPGPNIQLHCPNYPPPLPFYFPASGVNSAGGSGAGINGPLVTPFSHQMAPVTTTQPSMATQGFYYLQPPTMLHPQQQVKPQVVQQPTPIYTNSSSHDINSGLRNDVVQQNKD